MIYTSTSLLSLEAFCTAETGPPFGGRGIIILYYALHRYKQFSLAFTKQVVRYS
jgi:hypothetical protein